MSQCVATIMKDERCQNDAIKGYRYCEEHKTRPKAIEERQNASLNNVIDATEVFAATEVTQPAKKTSVAVPRAQQSIYEKTNGVLERALDWEEQSWGRVKALTEDDWRYQDKAGAEQLRSEIAVYERAQDRVLRAVTAIAKLNIDAQSVNVNKMVRELVKGVVMKVFQRMGLDTQQIDLARQYLAEEFEKVAADQSG